MLMDRRGEQPLARRGRRVAVSPSDLANLWDLDPEEAVAFAVATRAGLEEPLHRGGVLRIRELGELVRDGARLLGDLVAPGPIRRAGHGPDGQRSPTTTNWRPNSRHASGVRRYAR